MTDVAQPTVRSRRRPGPSARRRGWSEGDAWTVGIGLLLALALAVTTIPAALEDRPAASRAPASAAAVPAPPELAPAAPAAPAPAPPPAAGAPQSLLGPLTPVSAPAPIDPEPAPGPAYTEPATAPLAPGSVRVLATLPAVGAPGAVAAGPAGVAAATDAPAESAPDPAKLLRWDALGALQDSIDVPEQPSTRTRGVTALAQLPDTKLVAADAATGRVLRYDPATSTWSVLARLPDLVTCLLPTETPCQPGITDTPPLPRGIAVDETGAAFVADAGQGTVWRLQPGKPIEVWYQSADLAGDEGIAGLAFDGQGDLLAAVTQLADVTGPGAGALLRIERGDDGSAGTRSVVTAFQAGEDPVDVVAGSTGSIYVALRGADALVVLDRQGVEALRVVDDVLKKPTAVDLVSGRVVVTAAAPRAAVLEVGVADRPVTPRT